MTFLVDNVSQTPTVTVSNGQAHITLSNLGAGVQNITATYNGDNTNFAPSTSTAVTQIVNRGNTSTTLGASLGSSVFGQQVTFYAASWVFAPAGGTPTGTETIYIDNVSQGPIALSSGSNYLALSLSSLSAGNHTIYAMYSGDGNFNSSTSTTLTFTVARDVASNTLSANVSSSVFGQTVSFYGAAWAFAPGGGTPTGTMTYYVDGASFETVAIGSGVNYATLNLSTLSLGSHTLQTVYGGDSNFIGTTSKPLSFQVYWLAAHPSQQWACPRKSFPSASR